MVATNKKMQEVCNFLQQHQHDADVKTAFSEAKELIASEMLQVSRKEFFLNLSIREMCEEWAVARYLAHFSCVEGAMEKLFNYERTLSLAYNKTIEKMLEGGDLWTA
ncbi:hypothetical protein [Helicobacter labetoulli]|uniref:hypothetical protein n=1 Tax=Helicobacter labetoulli TaxID=2315333 RepID=UPI000EF6ADD2|nr:hypothetical protein [Helicobacter labetoulli]